MLKGAVVDSVLVSHIVDKDDEVRPLSLAVVRLDSLNDPDKVAKEVFDKTLTSLSLNNFQAKIYHLITMTDSNTQIPYTIVHSDATSIDASVKFPPRKKFNYGVNSKSSISIKLQQGTQSLSEINNPVGSIQGSLYNFSDHSDKDCDDILGTLSEDTLTEFYSKVDKVYTRLQKNYFDNLSEE